MSNIRPKSAHRINTRLEAFLAKYNVEFIEQEGFIEDNKSNRLFNKFAYKLLIVCHDRIYLTDNPPKNLDNFVSFDDILDITIHDDVPKFLNGREQATVFHIALKYKENVKRKSAMNELTKKMLELKKRIVYTNTIDQKLVEVELNTTPRTPRTFRSMDLFTEHFYEKTIGSDTFNSNTLLLTNRSQTLNTNRTAKSVRFEDESKENKPKSEEYTPKLETGNSKKLNKIKEDDFLLENAVNDKYKHIVDYLEWSRASVNNLKSSDDITDNLFSLSLPFTPRSIEGTAVSDITFDAFRATANKNVISKYESKSLEAINDKINLDFLSDTDKKVKTLHMYFVNNPKSKIFLTLKNAHFNSKIRCTLNYHDSTDDEVSKTQLELKLKKNKDLEKKFNKLKVDIQQSVDSLDLIEEYYDELLFATNELRLLKKLFWKSADLYKLTVNQISRYLPNSPANMKLDKIQVILRRIKELVCATTFIETLCVMFSETEFYGNRNEFLYEEKCKYLFYLMKCLTCDPELAMVKEHMGDQEKNDLKIKMNALIPELVVVSGILLFEILHLLSLNSWNNTDFTLEICVKSIEESKHLELFLARLINELSKMLNDNTAVVLTAQKTVAVFKLFTLLHVLIEKTSTKVVKNILRENYQEEFKYYFGEDRIKLKTYNYYPIISDLHEVVKKLQKHVL